MALLCQRQHSFGNIWKVSSPTDSVRCSTRRCSEILLLWLSSENFAEEEPLGILPSLIINRDPMFYTGQLNSQLSQGAVEDWAQAQKGILVLSSDLWSFRAGW